jgi:hypothetical protein
MTFAVVRAWSLIFAVVAGGAVFVPDRPCLAMLLRHYARLLDCSQLGKRSAQFPAAAGGGAIP